MSRRYWLAAIAIGIALACSGLGLAKPPDQAHEDGQWADDGRIKKNGAQDAIEALPGWLWDFSNIVGCVPYAEYKKANPDAPSQGEYENSCDLRAQESMAYSARWILWIAIPQFLLTILATAYLMRTFGQNRKVTIAAEKTLESQVRTERAYLFLKPDFELLRVNRANGRIRLTAKFRIKNYGKTPAVVTYFSAGVGPITRWDIMSYDIYEEYIDLPLGIAIGSETETRLIVVNNLVDKDIVEGVETIGCMGTITYRSVFGGEEHTTGFGFIRNKRDRPTMIEDPNISYFN